MEYSKIISVTGLSGLYELISSKSDGAIVRSLEDKSTKFVSARIHNFSHLESIEIYTTGENKNLVEILKAMDESKDPLPNEKDPAAVKTYFRTIFPDLDFERVYASDMKKMVKWYSILKKNDIEFKLKEEEEALAEDGSPAEQDQPVEVANDTKSDKKTVTKEVAEDKKVAPKKAAAKKTAKVDEKDNDTEEKAVKTKSAKKKTESTKTPDTSPSSSSGEESTESSSAPKKRATRKKKTEE